MLERTLPAPSIAVVNLYSSAAEGCRMRIDSRSEADLSLHAVAAIRRIPRERVEPIYFAAVLRDAAWCCGHADRFEEGQALMQESLDLFRSILGDQGHVVATTHARFADLYLRWNKPVEALEHARRAFELGDTAASMPTDQRLEMLSSLVRALLANGLTAEAQTAAERFGALNDSFFGDVTRHGYLNHESWWMLARANWTLSVAARANGDADRADALVQQSVADWRRAADWLQSSYGSPPGNEPPWREYGVPLLRDEKLTF
jgi:HAMP domain-containing protein